MPDTGFASQAGEIVLGLREPEILEPSVAGAKAAALARAAVGGLPVLPGWVLTTRSSPADAESAARTIWARNVGCAALVVRSSSTVEDGAGRSMAGLFRSVTGVTSERALAAAITDVLASADTAARGILALAGDRSAMAVLIQPELAPALGGVAFGVDPVSGRRDRLSVVADRRGPVGVVAGETGETVLLTPGGRRVGGSPILNRSQARTLARLAREAAKVFGGPQDIEWGTDAQGRIWLLQSRPVTAIGDSSAAGSKTVFGPGSLAETFPEPLAPLEVDLWVHPLSEAVSRAIALVGAVPARRTQGPAALAVGGWVAGDLELFARPTARPGVGQWLHPGRCARRLLAAWRVGRLRAALPNLAADLLARADSDLAGLDPLPDLSDAELVDLLGATHGRLVALHGHEVLMGLLADPGCRGLTAASVALGLVREGRDQGLSDAEIIGRHPTVLALLPPQIGPMQPLPDVDTATATGGDEPGGQPDDAELREALRLRVRWVQELGARAAHEIGRRLSASGLLAVPTDVAWMRMAELRLAVSTGQLPPELAGRVGGGFGPPLPERFRLDLRGRPAPVATSGHRKRGRNISAAGGTGAGGGRAQGRVHQGQDPPRPGDVWVVASLDPRMAPWLARVGAVVAETGTPLSHLAVLAREMGIPAVVGLAGARERFAAGCKVVVDGSSGEVRLLATPAERAPDPVPDSARGAA